jgi:hypothetical protein
VKRAAADAGYKKISIAKDFAGIDRIFKAER